jgi:hypothetical protein
MCAKGPGEEQWGPGCGVEGVPPLAVAGNLRHPAVVCAGGTGHNRFQILRD